MTVRLAQPPPPPPIEIRTPIEGRRRSFSRPFYGA
jgi:hypothetical protein